MGAGPKYEMCSNHDPARAQEALDIRRKSVEACKAKAARRKSEKAPRKRSRAQKSTRGPVGASPKPTKPSSKPSTKSSSKPPSSTSPTATPAAAPFKITVPKGGFNSAVELKVFIERCMLGVATGNLPSTAMQGLASMAKMLRQDFFADKEEPAKCPDDLKRLSNPELHRWMAERLPTKVLETELARRKTE